MWEVLKNRWRQGHRTIPFPAKVEMPKRFRGRPALHPEKCRDNCNACEEICPAKAICFKPLSLDLGRCLFCAECSLACPEGAIAYSQDISMAVRNRKDLVLQDREIQLATAVNKKIQQLFGRSLKLRAVCAGSCNGCDLELQALNNVIFDLSRFGIQFVASPRHADGLVVTGPVTENMKFALMKTMNATPAPKIIIAVGACAIDGGPFEGGSEVLNGVDKILKVDLYVPGCPPHPLTILDGILRLLGRLTDIG